MPDDQTITDEPQGHRAGAWVVLVVGVIGLGLGIYQWHGSFASAFGAPNTTFKTPDQIEADRIEAMKTKDTDGDGLTDYDETYVYKTSPYLKDSDSDGTDDKTEVEQGDDPNCPKGKVCNSDLAAPGLPDQTAAADTSATSSYAAPTPPEQISSALLNPTPDQIRALLVQSGAKEADVKNIDDATLLDLYQQSLKEAQSAQDTTTSP